MKRFILIAAIVLLAVGAAFAQGISEVPGILSTPENLVDLTTGTTDSDRISASFDGDGNLQITYKGTEPIEITLTGILNGTLIVKSDNADYTLVLDNAEITGQTLPAIQLKSTTKATIRLADGSYNSISDSINNTKKGVITSSGDIVLEGTSDSFLYIHVFKKHGIKADGGVTVNGGDILIHGDKDAEGNMISADLFYVQNGGKLTIAAEGNVHASESKGIKVNGVEGTGAGLGYVEINGGSLYISSVGKAITAGWKQSEDATSEDTSDDPIPNVYINGGRLLIVTTGTPYEISDDESLSPEGIEAKNILYINGGETYLYTTDDSLNAGKSVIINGGFVYAVASDNDCIDSNGTIEINGGTVVAFSSSNEQAFDCDNDTNFKYTGGVYVGVGNGNNMPKATGTTGYSIAYGDSTFYAGDQIAVLDPDGNVVIGVVIPYAVERSTSIVFGTEAFEEGKTYTIALGAFESQPQYAIVEQGDVFRTKETLVSMDLTDHAVSQGYIGMNIGTAGDFGNFGPGNNMPQDFQDRGGMGYQQILQTLVSNAQDVTLPDGVVLPKNLDSEEAIQTALYLLANCIDMTDLQSLVQSSMENGEFDGNVPTPPGGMPSGFPGPMNR